MFIIPGALISVLTFPGVIVHEAAHMLACKLRNVAVLDVCFFRFGNPAGYVIHEEVNNFNSAFLISVGPFLLNSVLCILICFPSYLPIHFFGLTHPLSYILVWLGVSIGMHSFPSNQDAKNLLYYARKEVKEFNLLAIISFPIVLIIFIANLLSFFWIDYIYGIWLGYFLPSLIYTIT